MALVNATRLTSIIDVEALTSSKPSAPILPGRPPRSRRRASEREGSHVYQRSSTPADVGRGSGGWSGGRRGLGGGPGVRCCTIAGRGAGRVGRWLPGAAMAGATPPIAVRRRRLSGPGPGRRGRAGSARGIGRLSRNLGADLRCCRQYRRLRPFSELPLRARVSTLGNRRAIVPGGRNPMHATRPGIWRWLFGAAKKPPVYPVRKYASANGCLVPRCMASMRCESGHDGRHIVAHCIVSTASSSRYR